MDKVFEFLKTVENDYKADLLNEEHEISRIQSLLDDSNTQLTKLQDSIDPAYAIMSSSQMSKNIELAEIDEIKHLITEYEKSLLSHSDRVDFLKAKVLQVSEVITFYENNGFSCSVDTIDKKLEFISKLVEVDSHRAISEINNLRGKLK